MKNLALITLSILLFSNIGLARKVEVPRFGEKKTTLKKSAERTAREARNNVSLEALMMSSKQKTRFVDLNASSSIAVEACLAACKAPKLFERMSMELQSTGKTRGLTDASINKLEKLIQKTEEYVKKGNSGEEAAKMAARFLGYNLDEILKNC